MEYEQKYKEALKVIEGLYDVVKYQSSSDALLTCQTIEKAFPELTESEDERIRKDIIRYIKKTSPAMGENIENMIAWLEKQGEKGEKGTDTRYKYLEELLAADDIYQMAMNDDMVQEAKTS